MRILRSQYLQHKQESHRTPMTRAARSDAAGNTVSLKAARASTEVSRASTGVSRASTGVLRASTGVSRAFTGNSRASTGVLRAPMKRQPSDYSQKKGNLRRMLATPATPNAVTARNVVSSKASRTSTNVSRAPMTIAEPKRSLATPKPAKTSLVVPKKSISAYITNRRSSIPCPPESIKITGPRLQPLPIQNRRKTLAMCEGTAVPSDNPMKNITIELINAGNYKGVVNVVLHFYNEGPEWYTKLYRSYEGDIWKRIPRESATPRNKWLFKCFICERTMTSFVSLKSHLNLHYGFYPNRCTECPKKYPSRNSLLKHRKSTNHIIEEPVKRVP